MINSALSLENKNLDQKMIEKKRVNCFINLLILLIRGIVAEQDTSS